MHKYINMGLKIRELYELGYHELYEIAKYWARETRGQVNEEYDINDSIIWVDTPGIHDSFWLYLNDRRFRACESIHPELMEKIVISEAVTNNIYAVEPNGLFKV